MYEYSNDEIIVKWDARKCIHSEVCVKNMPEVFIPANKPWINVAGAETKRLIETIDKCPSGALSYELKNKTRQPESGQIPELIFLKNGPVKVKGKVRLIDSEGNETIKENTFSLCRCGGSQNKPFCDGTHNKNGFSTG